MAPHFVSPDPVEEFQARRYASTSLRLHGASVKFDRGMIGASEVAGNTNAVLTLSSVDR